MSQLIKSKENSTEIQVIPHIEDSISLPQNKKDAKLDLTANEELNIRANTIKELADISGDVIEPTAIHREEAEKIARDMMTDPSKLPEYGNYPNETMAYLAGLVAQTNCMLVKDMADFKLHVLNRAVQEAETAKSSRERLAALRMIGEIDGVDAFKRRTEITHITKSGEELEKELIKTIEELKGKIVEGEVVDKDD